MAIRKYWDVNCWTMKYINLSFQSYAHLSSRSAKSTRLF
jgi:hypothetical protein